MSLDIEIPPNVERGIQKFALEEHISHDEAVLRLIEAGLTAGSPRTKTVFEQGLGLFGSPDDAALLDEVVSLAYEERRKASTREPAL